MTKAKYTPWFSDGENPVRVGIYNVSCRKTDQTGDWWSYWNGEYWGRFTRQRDPDECMRQEYSRSYHQNDDGVIDGSWRGLTGPFE